MNMANYIMSYTMFGQILFVQNILFLGQLGPIHFCPKIFRPKSFSPLTLCSYASFVQMIFVPLFHISHFILSNVSFVQMIFVHRCLVRVSVCTMHFCPSGLCPFHLGPQIIERMRAPVREAFSYGIRHWIRHIHCDSMNYDQIRVKPWETIPRIIPRIPQYGVWYSAECMHWNAKKSVVNHFKNRLKLW